MNHHIRPATPSDEPFLWEMLYLAIFVPPGQPPLPRSIVREPAIARFVENWGDWHGDRALIAEIGDQPIGAAWMRLFSESCPGYGFVAANTPEISIAILPAYRNQGVGSHLLEELLRDVPAASLSCDPANPARALYLRLGFRPQPDGRTMIRRTVPG